jgi:hypothetical protein
MTEIAELFSVRLGQPVNYEHRPPAEQRRVLSIAGVPQLFIDVLVGLDHIFASSAQSETTMTVAEVLGRPPPLGAGLDHRQHQPLPMTPEGQNT